MCEDWYIEREETAFEESLEKFKQRLRARGYANAIMLEVNFASRTSDLTQKKKTNERNLPFVTNYHPAVKNLKTLLIFNNVKKAIAGFQ